MAPRKLYNFLIDPDLAVGLKALKEREGVAASETVRRAVRAWLVERGVLKPARRADENKPRGKKS